MAVKPVEKIWMNGKLVNWDDAKIHILSHVIHYGSSWFEGIRCYETKRGSAIFRLKEHIDRLFDSTKMYRSDIPYTREEVMKACKETIKANKLKACYIRPIAYRGYGDVGVNPFGCPVDLSIAVWEWGKYLGPEALEKGIDVKFSSWNRAAQNTFPTMAKAGGNYLNSQLIKMEAIVDGYVEGIALDVNGVVSEGSGENLFVVKNGTIMTPLFVNAILPGITRNSVIQIAKDAGIPIVEGNIPRELVYIADEVFFTGTAAEISPIRSVDKIQIGEGKIGPITKELQKRFFDIVENGNDPYGWLDFVE
ncbi:MAG: branched-chain amino acid transaminase [Bacteroidota bacterium]